MDTVSDVGDLGFGEVFSVEFIEFDFQVGEAAASEKFNGEVGVLSEGTMIECAGADMTACFKVYDTVSSIYSTPPPLASIFPHAPDLALFIMLRIWHCSSH